MSAENLERPLVGDRTRLLLRPESFGNVIDGQEVAGRSLSPVIDPATMDVLAYAADSSHEELQMALRSSRTAFDDGRWRNLPPLERERRLHKWADLIESQAEELAELDVLNSGLLKSHMDGVLKFAVNAVRYFAGWPTKLSGRAPATPTDSFVVEVRSPVGVVALITPWNGPSAVAAFAAAILAAGNTVILKPADETPLSAVILARLALEAGIPPGVLNVLLGSGANVGPALVEAPEVDAISFTGSLTTGSAIQAAAARRVKRVSLELGGKNAFIIFPDADLDAAVPAILKGIWGAAGQVCNSGSRLVVHSDVAADVIAEVLKRSRGLRIGHGLDPATEIGPLSSARQLERVRGLVESGIEQGGTLALGGNAVPGKGCFFEPTIFTDVSMDMQIAHEEIFGPVLSVLTFDSEADAFRIANSTEYGLTAGVWTRDSGRTLRAANELRAGTVWLNTYQANYPSVSYGGVGLSGYGRMMGEECLSDFTETKTVWFGL